MISSTRIALAMLAALAAPVFVSAPALAQAQPAPAAQPAPVIVEKKVFELESYTTVSGRTLKKVRVGWQSMGTLNADRSNVILITHFFSGTSHFAGRYRPQDANPGYWDAIIGPGKAIDTDKYFVISVDSLVNLNAKDPNVTTTGPASIDPDTGKPYGMSFPIVTIRDFVNVQKAVLESLGVRRLHAVMGASMGALQAYEWATSYPQMVARVIPVIGAGGADAHLIAWLDVWAAPIRLDPNWNNGDYYGRTEPVAGLAQSLLVVTLHANHWEWANATFGRRWADPAKDPAAAFDNRFAIEQTLLNAGRARAAVSDANHFLYLVKANQIFLAGGGSLADGLRRIDAPVLLITQPEDLVFVPESVNETVTLIRADGTSVEHIKLEGTRGHLDGVLTIQQAGPQIRAFLEK